MIGRAVESLVEARAGDVGTARLGGLDQRDRDLIVGGLLHDLVGDDKAVLVLHHGHTQPQLDRDAGLALTDPLGVTLKDREDLLRVRDGFVLPNKTRRRIWSIWRSASLR